MDVFDSVGLIVRAKRVWEPPAGHFCISSDRVVPIPQPYYEGPWQFALRYASLRASVSRSLDPRAAVILRAPHALSDVVFDNLAVGRPFGVEVVGDPGTVFAPGSVRSVLGPVLQRLIPAKLRLICRRAAAVSYVTRGDLQDRYPAGPGTFVTHYSSVEMPPQAFAVRPMALRGPPFLLFHAGSMGNLYKSQDLLIRALRILLDAGMDVRLRLAGDGQCRPEFETLAARLGVAGRTEFLGQLPGPEAVRREIDAADLFVLPSRSEGLPRALIEAMGRGVPCIGSDVGGIKELLPVEDRVRPLEGRTLAARISEVLESPVRRLAMGERNLGAAREYADERLRARRRELYLAVKEATERWLAGC